MKKLLLSFLAFVLISTIAIAAGTKEYGDYYFMNGNVGIGTTSPGALLDVGLAGTTLGVIRLEGSTSGYTAIQPNVAAGDTTLTLPAATDTLIGKATTDTLTNKRITPRVLTFVSDATPDVDSDSYDVVTITAQAAAITDVNVTGTPTNFQKLIFRILDNGTARAITWGSDFQAMGVDLPTTTTISKVLTVGFIYDTVDSKWGCVAVSEEE